MGISLARSAIPLAVATALAGSPAAWAEGQDEFDAAQKAAFNGQRDQATMLYTRAIRSGDLARGKLIVAMYQRGRMHSGQGRVDQAIADFDAVVRLNARHALAHRGLGRAYFVRGQTRLGLASLNKAIELRPDHAVSWTARGYVFFALGRFEEAAANFDRAATLKTRNTFLPIIASVARLRAGRKGTKAIARAAARYKRTTWTGLVMRLWTGAATPQQVLARANRGSSGQKCDSNFYVGQYFLLARVGAAAKKLFEAAAKICPSFFTEGTVAKAELSRMARSGGWSGK